MADSQYNDVFKLQYGWDVEGLGVKRGEDI